MGTVLVRPIVKDHAEEIHIGALVRLLVKQVLTLKGKPFRCSGLADSLCVANDFGQVLNDCPDGGKCLHNL